MNAATSGQRRPFAARGTPDLGWGEGSGVISVYIQAHVLVANFSVDDKAGAAAKPVDKLYVPTLSQLSSLSRISDAL